MKPWVRLLLFFIAIAGIACVSVSRFIADDTIVSFFRAPSSERVLFVGDVMLARSVERTIRGNSIDYLFRNVAEFQKSHAFVVGNFESAMLPVHRPTEDFTFQFSTATSSIETLLRAGFTHVSLANNHTFDYGQDGYDFAQSSLRAAGLVPFGHPLTLSSSSTVTYIKLGDSRIALIGIHAVWHQPNSDEIRRVLESAEQNSDYQIAVVHWGTEYEGTHSAAQETLAHTLIDNGCDAIIGHHPHVVQDIGIYKRAPIFYSLGNYVFDQFWDDTVQTGLAISLAPSDRGMMFSITPMVSVRSVPSKMSPENAEAYLEKLAEKSAKELQTGIARGVFEVRR